MTETEKTPKLPVLRSGGAVAAFIPDTMEDIWRIANMAAVGGMAPKSLIEGKDANGAVSACAIAIMAGAELGLTPLMSLRSYAVVNGRPSLWGDGLIAVVRKSGIAEFINSGADAKAGWCESKRKDTGETMRREFTIEQAKKAELLSKKGPWQQYPDLMMERRAIALCLTRLYADILGGVSNGEDAIDDGPLPGEPKDITPPRERPTPPPPPTDDEDEPTPTGGTAAPEEPSQETVDPETVEITEAASEAPDEPTTEVSEDGEKFLTALEGALKAADTDEDVDRIFEERDPQTTLADEPEDAMTRAFALKAGRKSEIKRELEDQGQGSMFPGDRPFK